MWFFLYLITTTLQIHRGWTVVGKTTDLKQELEHYQSTYPLERAHWKISAVYQINSTKSISPVIHWLRNESTKSYHDHHGVEWSNISPPQVEFILERFKIPFRPIDKETNEYKVHFSYTQRKSNTTRIRKNHTSLKRVIPGTNRTHDEL